MRGKLIVVEGIDGCGKDTQIDLLVESMNLDPATTAVKRSNVSTSPTGRAIREVLSKPDLYVSNMQMATMFMSELYLVDKDISNLLDRGINVVMSRWYYSTLAYAGKELSEYLDIKSLASYLTCTPDYLIYLNIKPEEAIKRINRRDDETEKKLELYETTDKLKKISDRYETVLQMIGFENKTVRVIKLDASKSITDIHVEIKNNIKG